MLTIRAFSNVRIRSAAAAKHPHLRRLGASAEVRASLP
jgi:hypothetical protein